MRLPVTWQPQARPQSRCAFSWNLGQRHVKLAHIVPNRPRCSQCCNQRFCSRLYSTAPSGEGSELLDTLSKDELEVLLKGAIRSEEYARAAAIKSRIDKLLREDPHTRLQNDLHVAIKEERYEDAARLQKLVNDLKAREKEEFLNALSDVPTSSEAESHGVKVNVQSFFVPHQSYAAFDQYVFAYKVTITNNGTETVRLMTRHWKITDGTGQVRHVRGPGVVGRQPILNPGSRFEYSSACPLQTAQGTMEGEFNMIILDGDGEWKGDFEAKIAQFALKIEPQNMPSDFA